MGAYGTPENLDFIQQRPREDETPPPLSNKRKGIAQCPHCGKTIRVGGTGPFSVVKWVLAIVVVVFVLFIAARAMIAVENGESLSDFARELIGMEDGVGDRKGVSDKELIVGEWSCKVDLTEAVNQYFGQNNPGIKISDLSITLNWTFDSRGNFSVRSDDEAMTAMLDGVVDDMVNSMTTYLTSIAEESGITLEQLLDASGMTMDDLAQQVRDSIGDFPSINQSGKYEFKDDLLYIDDMSVGYQFDGTDTLNFAGGEFMDSLMSAMETVGFSTDVLVLDRV